MYITDTHIVCSMCMQSFKWGMCVQARAHFTILTNRIHYVLYAKLQPNQMITQIIDFRHQANFYTKQFLKLFGTHLLTRNNFTLVHESSTLLVAGWF